MPVDDRMRAQAQLILDSHPGAAAHPAADQWDDADDIDYLYRAYAILVREPDADARDRGARADLRRRRLRRRPGGGCAADPARAGHRRPRPPDGAGHAGAGAGPGRPPRRGSRAGGGQAGAQGLRVPGMPAPRPSRSRCRRVPRSRPAARPGGPRPLGGNDGDGVSVGIVDTGLIPNAAAGHPWLAGVQGAEENPYTTDSDGDIGDRSVRRPRDVRRRGAALRGPEGLGLRRAGLRHRGRRLRDEARCPAWRTPSTGTRTSWCSPSPRPPTAISPCTPSTTCTNGASAT